jgi:type III secretion protein T
MQPSLIIDAQNLLVTIALITPRALVCLAILPGFGMRVLQGMARTALAIGMVLPAALPTFAYVTETPPDYMLAIILAFKEGTIGLVLGVMLSMPIWIAQSIGAILDVQRSPIQTATPSIDPDASSLGGLLLQAVVLVMIEAGLFIAMSRIIIESYGIWPAFSLAPPFEYAHMDVLIKRFSEFFWHIIVYGGPVIIPLMLVDFGFAILGVFAPNLQVSFASSPIKSILGLFLLVIYWPIFSRYVAGDFSHILDFMAVMLQAGPKP